jgi:LPXTG-motif cell wall-anchored protein
LGGALLWIDDIGCVGLDGGSCAVVTCDADPNGLSDCTPEPIGPGLEIDEIEFLPNESGPTRPIQWIQDALAAETVEELPSTGSNTNLVSLAGALTILGAGIMVLRRRQTITASSRR